ncbi:hypothetical protein DFJ77DRAFT_524050 [Powellomyces hirtus]|nr:hypothetical protein DFJ77DRAFT_524050 [Powellomyces hirtus]
MFERFRLFRLRNSGRRHGKCAFGTAFGMAAAQVLQTGWELSFHKHGKSEADWDPKAARICSSNTTIGYKSRGPKFEMQKDFIGKGNTEAKWDCGLTTKLTASEEQEAESKKKNDRMTELEKKVEHIWNMPNGPAFQEAKAEFERLKNQQGE